MEGGRVSFSRSPESGTLCPLLLSRLSASELLCVVFCALQRNWWHFLLSLLSPLSLGTLALAR